MKVCPFSPPPEEELVPKLSASDPSLDADAIEWFVSSYGYTVPGGAPIARWVENLRRFASGRPLVEAGAPPAASRSALLVERAAIFDVYEAQKLAWSVRVLCSPANAGAVHVDASVVRAELLAMDNPNAQFTMPGGTGTLYQAARLLQADGGMLRVFGARSVGVDIEWKPRSGGTALIERKDRAFEAAALGVAKDFDRHVATRLVSASRQLPKRKDCARVVSIGYVGHSTETKHMQPRFREIVSRVMATRIAPEHCPEAAYAAIVGYGIVANVLDAVDNGAFIEIGVPGRHVPVWSTLSRAFRSAYDAGSRR